MSGQTVKSLIEKAKTRKGLRVFATIIEGVYENWQKSGNRVQGKSAHHLDEYLPQWNYIVQPQSS